MSIDVNCHMAGFVLGQFAKPLEVVGGVKAAGAESASKLGLSHDAAKKDLLKLQAFKLADFENFSKC